MKKKFYHRFFLLFFLIVTKGLQAQEKHQDFVLSRFSYAEKIYLQLSSTILTTDKTIWFKAIVTDVNHQPTQLSGVLHVELIDFDQRIIDKKLLKLENGISEGSFQLGAVISPGRYLIRAYTEWNRNFNENFISRHYIDIYAPNKVLDEAEAIRHITLTETASKQFELSAKVYPRLIDPKYRGKLMVHLDMGTESDSIEIKKDKQKGYYFNYLLPKDVVKAKIELKLDSLKLRNNNFGFLNSYSKTVLVDQGFLDLQFFPEGGKLVDGLVSKIGFKTLDYKNEGVVVSGKIVDQYDSIIVPFKTNTLGMGFTNIKPYRQKNYHAIIENNKGVLYKYKLPEVNATGYVMRLNNKKDYIRITVNSNFTQHDSLFLKVQSRGVTYHDISFNLKEGFVNLALEKRTLPEGIIKLTVLNKNRQPICERLYFNHKEDNRLQITAKTHLEDYSQRERTVIDLATKSKNGKNLSASLSVLVLNREQLGTMHKKRENILSYFLLNSELKGKIEKPMFYFDKKNKLRYRDLEALMLTQGWRNYIYEGSSHRTLFNIEPEKALVVSGTVGEFFNSRKRPKKPIELMMMTFGKSQDVFIQKVDSTGRFNFQLDDTYTDKLEFIIQSRTSKGKNKDYTINIDKTKVPEINYAWQERLRLADSIHPYLDKNIERKEVEQAFEIASGTIALKEVELSDYKLTPERQKMFDLHGPPDVVIEDEELHKKIKKWSYGLFSVLMYSYPEDINVRRVGSNGGFLIAEAYGADFTFIIIDGSPVRIEDYQLLDTLPTEEIKSVELIESPRNSRKYVVDVFGDPRALFGTSTISFINIYTYSQKGLFGVQKAAGIFKNNISGFAPKLEFYAPKHENPNTLDWKNPDLRSVVHWSPDIKTDKEGKAKVAYYNDDNIGDLLVIVEAISEDGKIGYFEMMYTVDKKEER